jgi:hypothetical protein
MKQFDWKKGIPPIVSHIISIAIFLFIAVIYCEPILQEKTLSQEDIAGWTGMVHQMQQYKETHGHFPLWNNRMFGGMPGYQIALESQNKLSTNLFHEILRLGLPAPIAFFFLLCLSFYFLSQVLEVNPWIGMLGALAYGYASFSAILVSAGHETEIQAMGYVPFLLGALILLYEKKYMAGTALTALFSSLLIGMNHLQISYYFVIVATCMTIAYALRWLKSKQYKHLLLAGALTVLAGTIGALTNATSLFTTYDYSQETMRNGGQRLGALENQGNAAQGLPIDYAFNWSYGKAETITLLVPNAFGGASKVLTQESSPEEDYDDEPLPATPKKSDGLLHYFKSYWGDQPSTSGPIYLGAVMCFLFLFGLVYLKSPHKKWLITVTVLAILMSWGKNFAFFNHFLFYHLPFYNKFRVPSMILFIPQLTFPFLVVLTLQQLFYGNVKNSKTIPDNKTFILHRFKSALVITTALLAFCACLYTVVDYRSHEDLKTAEQLNHAIKQDPRFGKDLLSAAADHRQALFGADLFRSFLLIGISGLLLWGYLSRRINRKAAIIGLGLLVFGDLITVDMRYLGYGSYMDKEESAASINPTSADLQIGRDHSWFRVLNLSNGPVNVWMEANTSYFHNSLGGYHPAKLSLMEDLITYQLNKRPLNGGVLDMLNTKYLILSDSLTQKPVAVVNPGAMGPCWFVRGIHWVDGPWTAMKVLDDFNPKDTAVIESSWFYKVSGLRWFPGPPPLSGLPANPGGDTTGYIRMINNDNDIIRYVSSAPSYRLAVFSEIYYPRGWKAYIDGVLTPIIQVDYALRGLAVPPGRHYIRFEFRPASYYMGEKIAGICTWLVFLLVLGVLIPEAFGAIRLFICHSNRSVI